MLFINHYFTRQMFLPFINGQDAYPTALADDKGRRAVILRSENAREVEDHFRHVSMEMGSAAGLAIAPVKTGELMGSTVLRFSFSFCCVFVPVVPPPS